MQYCFGGWVNPGGSSSPGGFRFAIWVHTVKGFMDLELSAGLDVAFQVVVDHFCN